MARVGGGGFKLKKKDHPILPQTHFFAPLEDICWPSSSTQLREKLQDSERTNLKVINLLYPMSWRVGRRVVLSRIFPLFFLLKPPPVLHGWPGHVPNLSGVLFHSVISHENVIKRHNSRHCRRPTGRRPIHPRRSFGPMFVLSQEQPSRGQTGARSRLRRKSIFSIFFCVIFLRRAFVLATFSSPCTSSFYFFCYLVSGTICRADVVFVTGEKVEDLVEQVEERSLSVLRLLLALSSYHQSAIAFAPCGVGSNYGRIIKSELCKLN